MRWWFKLRKKTPLDLPMVKYWKKQDAVKAKVTTGEDGALVMYMEGEDKPFPGFPRSYMLFGDYRGTGHGPLSVLKHTIKNEVFNYAWYALERGESKKDVIKHIKEISLPKVYEISDDLKYDLIPPDKMFKGVRELWRAMTAIEKRHPGNKHIKGLKETLALVMLDDDAYIMRLKWIIEIFNPSSWWSKAFFRDPIRDLDIALQELEVAEVMGDMKERIRLLRAGILLVLSDGNIRKLFMELCKEMDWHKLKLTEADKYHGRAKYFKMDLNLFEY